jgi:hypothetical protein
MDFAVQYVNDKTQFLNTLGAQIDTNTFLTQQADFLLSMQVRTQRYRLTYYGFLEVTLMPQMLFFPYIFLINLNGFHYSLQ